MFRDCCDISETVYENFILASLDMSEYLRTCLNMPSYECSDVVSCRFQVEVSAEARNSDLELNLF